MTEECRFEIGAMMLNGANGGCTAKRVLRPVVGGGARMRRETDGGWIR